MSKENNTIDEKFLNKLSPHMKNGAELTLKRIYALFPEINKKTISWRLYSLVQHGKLYKTGHGVYSMHQNNENNFAAGYDYLQKKSKVIYDILVDYGYDFYITGIDALVGEMLHMPENHTVLVVVEEPGIPVIQDVLNERDMIVLTEKNRDLLENSILKNKVDAILLKGKNFSLAKENISQKEKGFIDLYYAVTRMAYGVSIPELSRIYQSLQRNKSITTSKLKIAANDRGIMTDIIWLIELDKASEKTLEFMSYQIKEVK